MLEWLLETKVRSRESPRSCDPTMITNELQCHTTRACIEMFEEALAADRSEFRSSTDPCFVRLAREAEAAKLLELREEIAVYESWKASDPSEIIASSFDELAKELIRVRIASRLTERDLAERLDMREIEILRYESECYGSAGYGLLRDIADALGVPIPIEREIGGVD